MEAQIILVFTTAPDESSAATLADRLVESGLAACVKLLPATTATYRWKGQIERSFEIPMTIVARHENYAAIEQHLKTAHPYEVPEILAVNCSNGLPEYLRWVAESTLANPLPH